MKTISLLVLLGTLGGCVAPPGKLFPAEIECSETGARPCQIQGTCCAVRDQNWDNWDEAGGDCVSWCVAPCDLALDAGPWADIGDASPRCSVTVAP